MNIERYDEMGEPVYSKDGGPLKNLWKFKALINEENDQKEGGQVAEKFDYNEFFKKLYLSRAELDVTNSIMQLLLKEVNGNISLNAIHHEYSLNEQHDNVNNSDKKVFELKNRFLKEISADLKSTSRNLMKNRTEEHETIYNVLIELREKYHWILVRISTIEQILVNFDYQEMTPIFAIDFSPASLFKDSSFSEQYNYKLSHQISGENLALILRDKCGGLRLHLQSKLCIFDHHVIMGLKNCESGEQFNYVLFEKKLSKTVPFETLDKWNDLLFDARNRLICLNVMKILSSSASKFPTDSVNFSNLELNISIQSKWEINIKFQSDCELVKNFKREIPEAYKYFLNDYLRTFGKDVNWAEFRNQLLMNQ